MAKVAVVEPQKPISRKHLGFRTRRSHKVIAKIGSTEILENGRWRVNRNELLSTVKAHIAEKYPDGPVVTLSDSDKHHIHHQVKPQTKPVKNKGPYKPRKREK